MHIGRTVENFLREVEMPPTKFGRDAANDPRLVHDLRMGREPGAKMRARLLTFIETRRAGPRNGALQGARDRG